MFRTFIAEFAAAWNTFVRLPLPAFLSGDGERSDFPEIDGHPALLRMMMPLIGFALGVFACVPLWVLHLLPSGRLPAGIFGMALIPLGLDGMTSWRGLTALADFLNARRQGKSLEAALAMKPGTVNDPRDGISMILMLTVYLVRMIFCGVLAVFSPFWFMIALTGAWLLRAELCSLNPPGAGGAWLAVPRGLGKHHWYLGAGAMLAGGFLHPLGVILAFAVSWAGAWLAGNLCLDSISGINRQALEVFGYAAELLLLFLGILLYAAV